MLAISKVIADEVLAIFRQVLDSPVGINNKIDENTLGEGRSRLYDECVSRLEQSDDIVVNLLVNNYVIFVESGRRIGARKPPFNAILEWAKRKHLPTDNGFIWAVIQSIVIEGIKPRPVIQTMFDIIDRRFDDVWGDEIFNEIVRELDKVFE